MPNIEMEGGGDGAGRGGDRGPAEVAAMGDVDEAMTDPRTAALALPIHDLLDGAGACGGNGVHLPWDYIEKVAAAILAALPADWCGHHAVIEGLYDQIARQAAADGSLAVAFDAVRAEAEIARLRRIEEDAGYLADAAKHLTDHLAREHPDWYCEDMDTTQHFAAKVRAALEEKP